MNRAYTKGSKGLTLIELSISLSIVSIMLVTSLMFAKRAQYKLKLSKEVSGIANIIIGLDNAWITPTGVRNTGSDTFDLAHVHSSLCSDGMRFSSPTFVACLGVAPSYMVDSNYTLRHQFGDRMKVLGNGNNIIIILYYNFPSEICADFTSRVIELPYVTKMTGGNSSFFHFRNSDRHDSNALDNFCNYSSSGSFYVEVSL